MFLTYYISFFDTIPDKIYPINDILLTFMGETIIKIFGIIPLADNTYVCNGFVFCYNKIN